MHKAEKDNFTMSNPQTNDPSPLEALSHILATYLKDFRITTKELNQIEEILKPLYLEKGAVFCKKGRVSDKIGILMNGLLYAYYESPKKTEEVSRFFFIPENFIVSSFESFVNQTPSNETIKAIENCELYCITYKDLQHLYDTIPQMNFIGRQLAEVSYIRAMQRIHDLQALDAESRVKIFLGKYPHFYNIIKRELLASYLKMNRNLITKYFRQEKKK